MAAPQAQTRTQLNLGVNLRGLTGGVNFQPGQAQDAMDVLPREDGGFYSHWGWLRTNAAALNGNIVAIQLFTYKGKNAGTPGNVREGNFGIADDAGLGQCTRRLELYTGAIVLTDTTFYFWDPVTEAFIAEALPGAAVIDVNPKPTCIVVNDNVYIVGYSDFNLRYDPTDRALYYWGWDNLPTTTTPALNAAAGTLIVGATYQYATAWWDVYTGEVGPMGTIVALTPTAALPSVNFAVGAFPDYAGTRHFVGAGDNDDVGVVVYRTGPNGESFYFLDAIEPIGGLAAAGTLLDDGLATAKSEKALRSDIADEPRFNAADLFNDIIYGISWDDGYVRVYYNDWKNTNSHHERWPVTNRSTLPTRHGEALTAITHVDRNILAMSQQRGFLGTVSMSSSGRLSLRWFPLDWTVGCVGPKAHCQAGPWMYFLSERGPYRWKPGLEEPQWIGRDLLALFIDPTSGLCKLNPEMKNRSEVEFDLMAGVVRFSFGTGRSAILNTHLVYWVHDDIPGLDPAAGWFFCSTQAQCFAYGNSLTGLRADGTPANPFERRPRMVFGDELGYVNEYEIGHQRGGAPALTRCRGTVQAGSTVNNVITEDGLYQVGDGLTGMRLEIVHTDDTIDVRQITANTDNDITPDRALTQDPSGGIWYAAGYPSYWRSVPEHFGVPYQHKSIINLGVKLVAMRPGMDLESLDLSLQAGDYPVVYNKTEEVDLALYHDKTMGSASGRFIQVEVANSRPDGFFAVTSYAMWVTGAEVREADED